MQFFKDRTAELTKQNIETEKLKQKDFELTETKTNALVAEAQKRKEINNTLEGTNKLTEGVVEGTKGIKNAFDEIGNSIATGVSDALVGAIQGTKTLGQAASSILNDISSQLLRLGINTLLKSTGFGIFENLTGFANGGRPPVGRPSIVGERGPELFVPSTAGTIIPNHKMGGTTNNIVVNVDVDGGASVDADENNSKQFGLALAAAIQAEIINQKRAGGLLA